MPSPRAVGITGVPAGRAPNGTPSLYTGTGRPAIVVERPGRLAKNMMQVNVLTMLFKGCAMAWPAHPSAFSCPTGRPQRRQPDIIIVSHGERLMPLPFSKKR
jgi:hypothetical protein